jgi:predicted ATPase
LRRLLVEEGTRLITVTGPGGTGKTRLAAAAALSSLDHFTDGVFFVDLTEVTTSDVLVAAISETLGVSASDDARSGIEGHIGSKQMLILLDNFEQVVVAADVVTSLLHCCPKLQVLTTSRIALSVNGELEFSVDPLGLPNERTSRAVLASEAGQLFATRARAAKPSFAVTEENAASVAEICEVLDGLPLALELAAARLKLFPVDALLERLEDRLKLLTGGSSDSPTRHRTLRGTIEWSYDLLEAQERDFFRALAIFNGGATLEAIEEIVPSNLEAVDALTSLVNHSLIRQNELPDGGFRFSLLQTIRQFAAELLEEDPDRDALRIAHAEYYLKSLRVARKTNLDRDSDFVSKDLDNFRASLSWFEGRAEDSPPDQEALLELTGMLGRYWYMRGLVDEGSRWLASSLQHSAREARPSRALALRQLGVLKELHRNVDEARALFDEALDLYRTLGDELGQAACLNSIGVVVMAQGNLEAAEDFFTSSLEIRKRRGNDQAVASLSNLGVLHVHRGDPQRAAQFLEEALELDIAAGDEWGAAVTRNNLANAYLANGEVDRSVAMVTLGMEGCYKVEEYEGLCDAFETTALLAFEQGDAPRAARLFGAGQNLRDRIAIDPTMLDSKWIEAGTEKVRGALGREAFESLHSEGAQMTLEQSVNYALGRQQDLTEIVTRGEP